MTDEEMAEKYRKSLKQKLIDEDEFERLEMFDENVEEAYLAGLKAGRPQWHDLRKDQNDLPKEEGAVLIYWKCGDIKCVSVVEPYKVTEDTHIIAWKEIVLPEEE